MDTATKTRTALDTMRRLLTSDVEAVDDQLAKFKESLDKDAAYAFAWADRVIEATVRREIAATILDHTARLLCAGKSDDEVYELILKEITQQTLRRAREVQNSTSRCSNLVEDFRRAEWARLVDRFESWKR